MEELLTVAILFLLVRGTVATQQSQQTVQLPPANRTQVSARGEGIRRVQTQNGVFILTLTASDTVVNRRDGSMTFTLKLQNNTTGVIRLVNPRLTIVSLTDAMRVPVGNTEVFETLLGLTGQQNQKSFAMLNDRLNLTPETQPELDPENPFLRKTWESVEKRIVERNPGGVINFQFSWKFRNNLFERVAAGTYVAIMWFPAQDGLKLSSGWVKFVVQ